MPQAPDRRSILLATLAGMAGSWSAFADPQDDPLAEPFPAVFDLSTLDGTTGFALEGVAAGDSAGLAVAAATDINGDGIADAMIGAPFVGGADGPGEAYLVFGRGTPWPARVGLADLDGETGARLFTSRPTAWGDRLGFAVAGAGDINGDGFGDALVGAPFTWPGNPYEGPYPMGVSYTIFGREDAGGAFPASIDVATLGGNDGFAVFGPCIFAESGSAVAGGADINGDGVDDVAIGAAGAFEGYCYGDSYVLFGRSAPGGGAFPESLGADDLDGSSGFVFNSIWYANGGGTSTAVGDVNGDGLADAVFGTPREYTIAPSHAYDELTGATYVIFGRDTTAGERFPDQLDRDDLDGDLGIQLVGSGELAGSGSAVAVVGDINGDGIDDLAIGEPGRESGDTERSRGAVLVVFGRPGLAPLIDLIDPGEGEGFRLNGAAVGDLLGTRVAGAGDVNGDGYDDLIATDIHGAHVLFGRDTASSGGFPDVMNVTELDGVLGFTIRGSVGIDSIAGRADLNGDGRDDLLLGLAGASPGGRDGAGEVAVVFGRGALSCRVDMDGDGAVTIFDFLVFQNLFQDGDLLADFDGDGALTIFDFLAFQNEFDIGCP
ncbi:MAG: integrin alpha [Phycisphaera sp.]|nr:MAG: integrin alpha [Phycisphaera sp.]